MFERAAQFVIVGEHAAPGLAEAKTLVDPHQIGRGEDVNAQSRRLQNRAQIGDGRTLAVGAGDMDHRRQPAFGMAEPLQQPVHPLQIEIDALGMQRRQPRDQVAERRHGLAAGAFTLAVLPAPRPGWVAIGGRNGDRLRRGL